MSDHEPPSPELSAAAPAPANPAQPKSGLQLGQCRYGPMLFRANDTFIGRSYQVYGEMNELEVKMLCSLLAPGDTVLDVGANIGVDTIPFARRVGRRGRVIAYEPQRIIHQMLCANVALNGLTNVVTLWSAAGSAPGTIRVPPVDYEVVDNFGGIELGGDRGEPIGVATVDQLALQSCRLIKIDVETMELEVLRGAADTIARLKPRLYMENNRKELSAALIGHVLGLGYRLYWHFPPLFNPDNFRKEKRNVWGNMISVNMLALPPGDPLKIGDAREITSPDEWWHTQASGKSE